MDRSVKKAVPSAVAPGTGANTVPVLTRSQLGPYQPMSGKAVIPEVPVEQPDGAITPQPGYGYGLTSGGPPDNGQGAPTVPGMGGPLFTAPPIDAHYLSQSEARNPYAKVNNPPTRGMWTRIQMFLNGIATSQDVDNTGWKARHPQQRTSVMRNALPPHGMGYAPQTFQPHQLPQTIPVYKYPPSTGTRPYGTGVLNSDTYGAGQTAGGVGGNQYTPAPGPPQTVSTAGNSGGAAGMPSWG